MLTSRPRDKKGQDKEKRAAKARTFQVRRRSRRRRRRSRRRRYRRPSLGSFRPWPSLSITAAVIQINSSMIVKVVMIAKILIATCFDPISPGCPGFIDSIAVSQFHEQGDGNAIQCFNLPPISFPQFYWTFIAPALKRCYNKLGKLGRSNRVQDRNWLLKHVSLSQKMQFRNYVLLLSKKGVTSKCVRLLCNVHICTHF